MVNSADRASITSDKPWLFRRGQPGGPGRPKRVLTAAEQFARQAKCDLRNAAKEYTAEALSVILEIMRDPRVPPAQRLAAAGAVLDRGHGKARSFVEVSTNPFERMSEAELIEFIIADFNPSDEIAAVSRD